jgi:hypothetical protein
MLRSFFSAQKSEAGGASSVEACKTFFIPRYRCKIDKSMPVVGRTFGLKGLYG